MTYDHSSCMERHGAGNAAGKLLHRRKARKTTFEGTHEAVLENYLKLVPYAQKDYMGTSYERWK